MNTLSRGFRLCLFFLMLSAPLYAEQPVARSRTVGSQTFFYGKSGQYMGRSNTVGKNTFYYGFKSKTK